eukprot:2301093-Ditylum_brightwellii.AAC.1
MRRKKNRCGKYYTPTMKDRKEKKSANAGEVKDNIVHDASVCVYVNILQCSDILEGKDDLYDIDSLIIMKKVLVMTEVLLIVKKIMV